MIRPRLHALASWHTRDAALFLGHTRPMGRQQSTLMMLMAEAGWQPCMSPPVARMDSLPVQLQFEIASLYYRLGGLDPLPVRAGSWDMAFGDLVIELDEEQHFNRYRALTLDTPFAAKLPWRDTYLTQCASFEMTCRKKASNWRYWTNPSSEKSFGPSGPPGKLDEAGSPRWKQRAIYDAMRDATALSGTIRLARLSRWDEIDGIPLWQALEGSTPIDSASLLSLIADRTVG